MYIYIYAVQSTKHFIEPRKLQLIDQLTSIGFADKFDFLYLAKKVLRRSTS